MINQSQQSRLLFSIFAIIGCLITSPLAEFKQATSADLKPRFRNQKNFNEIWSYQMLFSNGTQAFINLSRINHKGDNNTGADMSFVNFKGGTDFVTCKYPAKKYFEYKDQGGKKKLSFHHNIWIEADENQQRIHFYRKKNGTRYFCDLTFTEMVPGLIPIEEEAKLAGGQTAGLIIQFPKAKVHGKIALNNDTIQVSGVAYSDHTYQSDLPTELISYGSRFFRVDEGVHAGLVLRSQKGTVFGYTLEEDGNEIKLKVPLSINKDGTHIKYKSSVDKWSGFQRTQKWQVLDELGSIGGFFAKKLATDLINIRGTAEIEGDTYLINRFLVD